jgi:O-methyltransferase involved in polyketide biosynthesis
VVALPDRVGITVLVRHDNLLRTGPESMADKKNPFPVSDTAALVMLWAKDYYADMPLAAEYMRHLDLSAGRVLLERYNRICPWYSEVIINRKHFIRKTIETLLGSGKNPAVILNLGAGFSPLALELAPFLSGQVRFVEMDLANMDKKTRLYADLVPDRSRFISCRDADIGDNISLCQAFDGLDDQDDTRLIVVMEGLSYYIPRSVMEQVIRSLSGLSPDMYLLFEHLKPCHLVSRERRYIPYQIFSDVRDYTGLATMTTYKEEDIRLLAGPGFSCRYFNMDEMERRRTGKCRYFPNSGSGWLSCAVMSRRA